MSPLVAAWRDALDSFAATVAELPDEAFTTPSLLPGWTVGDIIAHVVALEAELAGQPTLGHEPDWEALPHADDLFSRYTEVGVDARRGQHPLEIRSDLTAIIEVRSEQLHDADLDEAITGIGGRAMTVAQQLRMRCFDIVLHELDVRDALGMSGQRLGSGAQVCVAQIADALGYVWAKKSGATTGQVLHVRVPGWVDRWVEVGPDGRGQVADPGSATVTLEVPVMQFLRLGSGRTARISGDEDLGARVISSLNVAP